MLNFKSVCCYMLASLVLCGAYSISLSLQCPSQSKFKSWCAIQDCDQEELKEEARETTEESEVDFCDSYNHFSLRMQHSPLFTIAGEHVGNRWFAARNVEQSQGPPAV